MVDPRTMCRRHLLGEHVECHMFEGTIQRGISVKGYLDKGLLEVHNLKERHDELAREMESRGYRHNSPLEFTINVKSGRINIARSEKDLRGRCVQCRAMSAR